MSEFSQSYHLRANSKDDAVLLLNRAGKHGYVFESKEGWVTFVTSDADFSADEVIVANNQGILLHYVYAEDHGWELLIFNKQEMVSGYSCSWGEEFEIQMEQFDLGVVEGLVLEQGKPAGDLESLFQVADVEELFSLDPHPAYQVADLLGLSHYAWASYDYINADPEFFKEASEV